MKKMERLMADNFRSISGISETEAQCFAKIAMQVVERAEYMYAGDYGSLYSALLRTAAAFGWRSNIASWEQMEFVDEKHEVFVRGLMRLAEELTRHSVPKDTERDDLMATMYPPDMTEVGRLRQIISNVVRNCHPPLNDAFPSDGIKKYEDAERAWNAAREVVYGPRREANDGGTA